LKKWKKHLICNPEGEITMSKTFGKYNERDLISMTTTPKNESESRDYANALHSSGHYPAGLDGCFTVGQSGGCGLECWVYQEGKCEVADEMVERFETVEDVETHNELYGTTLTLS
jgi:hypothetical protein